MLQTAAVIGKTFSEVLLSRVMASVVKIGETELGASLSALVAFVAPVVRFEAESSNRLGNRSAIPALRARRTLRVVYCTA